VLPVSRWSSAREPSAGWSHTTRSLATLGSCNLLSCVASDEYKRRHTTNQTSTIAVVQALTLIASICGLTSKQSSRRTAHSCTRLRSSWFHPTTALSETIQRWLLKRSLLEAIQDCDRGVSTSELQSKEIGRLIDELAKLNPTEVARDCLGGRWKLLWTTEKETLSLVKGGFFGRPVTEVFQLIDTQEGSLSNNIEFDGGAFEVDSSCEPGDGIRVDFAFKGAKIRFGDFALPLPPVGQGWFDCVYLDDELRIVRDSRDDALIAMRE